jgi:hypothetical protein
MMSNSGECQQLQLNRKGSSFPILSKNSTDFTSVLWSQQQVQEVCQQQVTAMNDSIVNDNFTSLPMKTDINRSNTINILPVITPPPTMSCATIPLDSNTSVEALSLPLTKRSGPARLNKFVRRLHEMLLSEQNSGIVEWRKGLLVLHSTDAFTKKILPKYFGTKNFKTFRRQLNYYGFVHVRSFSATGSTTTALWVNQDLANRGTKSISSVLMLKRVEPSESSKTAEGRRVRKEAAASTVEDIGINTRSIQLDQIRYLTAKGNEQREDNNTQCVLNNSHVVSVPIPVPAVMSCQVSQNSTESTMSSSSSILSTPTAPSPPVPASVSVTSSPAIYPATPPDQTNHTTEQIEVESRKPIPSKDTSADAAANLLIMLSRSVC